MAAPSGALYLVFADNRIGRHDVIGKPFTNAKVFVIMSTDGGATWSAPVLVDPTPADQWFPWVDVNPVTGEIGIIYHQRRSGTPLYDTRFAVGTPGAFRITNISTAPSNPGNSAVFRAGVPGCANCADFHGDHIRVAYGSDGRANLVWTDMRRLVRKNQGPARGYTQNIFFARQ